MKDSLISSIQSSFDIALGSVAELDTQLILADDLGFLKYNEGLENKIKRVSALLQGLKKYLNNNE